MSFTNKTTHYELPQWTQNDIPTVLVDMNDAFSDIDTAIYNASVNGTEAKEVVETIQPTVTQLQSDVTGLTSDVLQNTASINTVNTKVTALQTQNGTEVLSTTAQTLSGAVNELKTDIESIPASTVDTAMSSTSTNAVQNRVIKAYVDSINIDAEDVSYDNTNSGLSATNVQDALDEITKHDMGTRVQLTLNTPYTCPSDGYVQPLDSGSIRIRNSSGTDILATTNLTAGNRIATYVRKGMVVHLADGSGYFYPIA